MNPDLPAALAVVREAVADALYLIEDGEPVEEAMLRVCALVAAAEAMLPAPARVTVPNVRPAPVAATLYARRVG